MKNLLILLDYKGHFESKWNADPYRSGFDLKVLEYFFNKLGYNCLIQKFSEINVNDPKWLDYHIIYTSQEDKNLVYKSFIEDIILALETNNCKVFPSFKYLRANNNKVFMEYLKSKNLNGDVLHTRSFCALEEIKKEELIFPLVMKTSEGAMSRGVFLIKNYFDLKLKLKKICNSKIKFKIKEEIRSLKHKGYKKEDSLIKKIILQPFIPNLDGDFKVLVFGKRYYVVQRKNRKNDFRASGSGEKNYSFGSVAQIPNGLFDYCESIYNRFDCPNLSLDIGYDGEKFFLIEFQSVYFGTGGHNKSNGYYARENDHWSFYQEIIPLEQVYAESLDQFICKQSLH
jgi:glutathione synthase/RimK-type ligase-like ATP-grasp enzyme